MSANNLLTLPAREMIHAGEIARATGVCKHTIYRAVKAKRLPQPVLVGRRFCWPREVIIAFLGLTTVAQMASGT